MSIDNTELASQIIKQTKSDVGVVHFFNHIAVMEFEEGKHIDLTSSRPILNSIIDYFGDTKPFGLIANRVNSYSVSVLEIKDFRQELPNLSAYGIICYNQAGKMNAKIESSICEWDNICYDNLYDGLDTVYSNVKKRLQISSN
ncbi:hypothetical protein [Winogradskyella flava]|uniref:hypothetical protein n=1 Tax=Winogradskyella flava TaxID=1884876 RepID=UPI002491BF92|nr:hypothetical protein [Winogradskyella flava]